MRRFLSSRFRFDWWPASIIAFFSVAVAAAISFVVFCSQHASDLVAEDYYEKELRYQQHLDRLERTHRLGGTPSVGLDASARRIVLQLPATQPHSAASGQVHLYRPSAAVKDRVFPLALDQDGRQWIDAQHLDAGHWRVKVAWSAQGQDYAWEAALDLPAGKSP